ncbi:ATP adenylyltransferase [Synechococcus sp. RSCCF101]|nr:ATP adenylyltransferase [Synechococcus sp. RSCCF101]
MLERALQRSRSALSAGALIPLETCLEREPALEPFQVRHLLSRTPKHLREPGPRANPFLPWDSRLEVERFDTGHVVLLNKFPVQPGHLLLITDHWQPQDGWLNARDWAAMARMESDTSGLWFFNSCGAAGASQPHRHLQLLPRSGSERACPLEQRYRLGAERAARGSGHQRLDPWWAMVSPRRERDPARRAGELAGLYRHHLGVLDCGSPEQQVRPAAPYNLLITPDWFLTIRRRRERQAGISVNALGFAGYLLTTERADRDWLRRHGGDGLLQEVVATVP